MKKLLIAIVTVSMFITGLTYASNTKPLTPVQKRIQAIKLAKLKKQQLKVVTGTVNTGNTIQSNCIIPTLTGSFSGSYESIYNQASYALTTVKKDMYSLNTPSCMQVYHDLQKRYNNWVVETTSLMNYNYYIYMRNKIIDLNKTLNTDQTKYNECVAYNNTVPYFDRKECGSTPSDILLDLEIRFNTWKKENNYK